MAHEQRLSLAAINITIHPHTSMRYVELIKHAAKTKEIVKIRGTSHGLLNGAYNIKRGKPEEGIEGEVSKFTQIDVNSRWLNTDTSKEAVDDDVKKVIIPENLKPNYEHFNYIFYPRKHLFVFQTYSSGGKQLSPNFMLKFLDSLFSLEKIKERFNTVDLTIVPDKDSLNKIWKIPRLEKLVMTIKRPNPDDFDDEEKEYLEEMNSQNTREIKLEHSSISGRSITPNERTKILARIAANNGVVSAKGKDQLNKPIEESTKAHPRVINRYYDSGSILEAIAVREYSKEFLS
ncbi:MAG: DUF4747 family protein [Candidatus Thiodiazotropha endolucinida]|nr:DUF4747 family protein [Candidatus Thiodiazotropha endolucinida]